MSLYRYRTDLFFVTEIGVAEPLRLNDLVTFEGFEGQWRVARLERGMVSFEEVRCVKAFVTPPSEQGEAHADH